MTHDSPAKTPPDRTPTLLRHAAFAAGLAVVAWVGAGYVGTNLLALAMTALVAAFFALGAVELQRFHRATEGLGAALDEVATAPSALGPWLDRVPASLRHAVRLRVEGERVGLPGPSLTPYLAGLLVLLGMLGTFLGMIVTLRGTGTALDAAADLSSVRGALVAPVKGLGLAFGTSVAGVAASAMLGLMSALCRRERVRVAQRLDARVATTLRAFSVAHQREESLRLLQAQADVMPQLVDRLQSMMAALERHAESTGTRLADEQQRFHREATAAFEALAGSVDRTLQKSLTEGARIAGDTIRPVAEATLAGVARETRALHETLAVAAREQQDALARRLAESTSGIADRFEAALSTHAARQDEVSAAWRGSLDGFAASFDARAGKLVEDVAAAQARALEAATAAQASTLATSTAALTQAHEASTAALQGLATETRESLAHAAAAFERHAATLAAQSQAAQLHQAETTSAQLSAVSTSLERAAEAVTQGWTQALARHEAAGERWAERTQSALASSADQLERQAAALLASVSQAHAEHDARGAEREQARLQAWTASLEAMAAGLRDEWRAAGEQSLSQQRAMGETMERTAREVTAHAEEHATRTIAEIGRLVQAASEAPRAAAEVVGALRQQLSESLARDTAVLEERGRLLETVSTLLDAVNRAATEQRGAIDALVASSAEVLERVGTRFAEQVGAETERLSGVAAQVAGGAIEVASLGEAFGSAVQAYGAANEQLTAQLQRIESALSSSMARSDEQLAYYVAQAREVVDLSLLSQKQILEELQQKHGTRSRSDDVVAA